MLPPLGARVARPDSTCTARGYVFQIELTYRTLRMGGRVVEVPITFTDRTAGESKMSRAIVLEAVWKVPALRLRAVRGRLDGRLRAGRRHRWSRHAHRYT